MAEGDLSMLDQMASGLMERKEAAAARANLTPVKGEKTGTPLPSNVIPDVHGTFLAQEGIEMAIREVRKQAMAMLEACDAAEAGLGIERPHLAVVPDVKAAEKAADAKAATKAATKLTPQAQDIADKIKALADKAKADTFKGNDDVIEGVEDVSGTSDSAEAIAAAAAEDAAESPLKAIAEAIAEEDKQSAGVLAAAAGLWVCPDHGTRQDTKSRKNRDMVACGSYPAECQKFEMPA